MESARGQPPGCSGLEVSEFALFVTILQREHGFEPSKALHDDLVAALVSLLPREPWLHKRSALASVLRCLAESGWSLSVSAHDRVLSGAAAGTAAAEHSSSTGPALTASQARAVAHAWRAFAMQAGSPARATLPVVLRAVGASPEAPMLGSVQRLSGAGAASELLEGTLHQLVSAQSVEDVARVHNAAGEDFGRSMSAQPFSGWPCCAPHGARPGVHACPPSLLLGCAWQRTRPPALEARRGWACGGVLSGFLALYCAYRSSVSRAGTRGSRMRGLSARAPLPCCQACGRRLNAGCQSAQRGSWAPQHGTLPAWGCWVTIS